MTPGTPAASKTLVPSGVEVDKLPILRERLLAMIARVAT